MELVGQLNDRGLKVDHLITATGSAGTQAGLVSGMEGTRSGIPVLGICVGIEKKTQEEDNAQKKKESPSPETEPEEYSCPRPVKRVRSHLHSRWWFKPLKENEVRRRAAARAERSHALAVPLRHQLQRRLRLRVKRHCVRGV